MSPKEYILVTGGAGYIGSHTTIELIQNGYNVVIVDNLCNSSYDAVARIEYIVQQKVPFFNVDIGDGESLFQVFSEFNIVGVIHFAALKAVGESTKIPLDYYYNNIRGTLSLLKTMKKANVKTVVFSSSATVYGDATRFKDMIPIPEHCPTGATNPYGRTKLMIEEMLRDIYEADKKWRAAVLRYFNPIGAHPSGLIGEDPLGVPNNLLPFLAQVAVGRQKKLFVFGNDYDSHDGTPIRDYIHVVDLAKGHISALEYLRDLPKEEGLFREWNLGTGKGSTVFDVYKAFCKAIGRDLPYEVAGRRAGDVLNLTANPTRANEELKWEAKMPIDEACRDLWKWTTENPYGFGIDGYDWKRFIDPREEGYSSRIHTVKNGDFEVSILNYGCTIQSIKKNGLELTCNFPNLDGYLKSENPYFGATVGRYANRIKNGEFQIDNKTFKVDKNENGVSCLHGGSAGLDKQMFLGPIVKQQGKNGDISLEFVHVDQDKKCGFPANLVTRVKYTIGQNSVELEFVAEISENSHESVTPVNLTNHTYFNISENESIDGIWVKMFTNEVLELDKEQISTGKMMELDNGLEEGKKLDASVVFDDCFIVDRDKDWSLDTRQKQLRRISEMKSENSGRSLEVFTTEPAYQFYTGDGVSVTSFEPRCGLCVEPGRFVNAINVPEWRKQVLVRKGDVYGSRTRYVFG